MKKEEASSTAMLIAVSLVLLSQGTSQLVSPISADFAARLLETHSATTRFILRLVRQSWFRSIAALLERATIPGILRHYALRKKLLKEIAQEALARGIKQVVVLGAGFDVLTVELNRESQAVRFWEVDHPATQIEKSARLTDVENLHFIATDLSTNQLPETALRESGFDPGQPTLWVAEGLLMYFHEEVVCELIDSIRKLSAAGSICAFTFMKMQSNGRVRFETQTKLVDCWLRWRGEPFLWGSSHDAVKKILWPWNNVEFFGDYDPACAGEVICRAQP